ncbi:MAG: diguanylate cyclase [Bdellovibrionales bacterium]
MVSKFVPDSAFAHFNILILDSSPSRATEIGQLLGKKKYQVKVVHRFEDFFATVREFVPHVLIIPFEEDDDFQHSLSLIKNKLPETHLLLLSNELNHMRALDTYEQGVYECIEYPLLDERILLKSVHRAIERDWLFYQAEQIKEVLQGRGFLSAPEATQEDSINSMDVAWVKSLQNLHTLDEFIVSQLKYLSKLNSNTEVLFFKYVNNHRSIIATFSIHEDLTKIGNLGIRLTEEETPLTITEMLDEPERIPSLNDLLKTVFKASAFHIEKLKIEEEYIGFYVIFSDTGFDIKLKDKFKLEALHHAGKAIHLQKKLFKVNKIDEVTGVLRRQNFFESMKEEVSRSRRILKPVCLLVISLDNYDDLMSKHDVSDMHIILRSMAKIFEQNSRVNDIVGRLGQFDFGLILPHTDLKGGAIKGERLRKVIESAQFGKTIKGDMKISVSVGVSEYPSHCADAEEIFQRADEAMFEARRQGGNKTCEGRALGQFTPDFEIN